VVGQAISIAKINQFEIINVTRNVFPVPEGTRTTDLIMLARAKN